MLRPSSTATENIITCNNMVISTYWGTHMRTHYIHAHAHMVPWAKVQSTSVYPSTCVTASLLGNLLPSQFPWQRFPQKRSWVDVMWSTLQWLLWGYQQWEGRRGGGGGGGGVPVGANTYDSQIASLQKTEDNLLLSLNRLLLQSLKFLSWKFMSNSSLLFVFKFTCDVGCPRKTQVYITQWMYADVSVHPRCVSMHTNRCVWCVFLACLPVVPPTQQKERKVSMKSEKGNSIVLKCNPPQSSMEPIIHWMDWSEYIIFSISASITSFLSLT